MTDDKFVASFHDSSRGRRDNYTVFRSDIDELVLLDIKSAFLALTGHYAARSRRQAWRSVVKFMDVLSSGVDVTKKSILAQFHAYLENSSRLRKTNGAHFNFIRSMVRWLSEFGSHELWSAQIIIDGRFPREIRNVRDNDLTQEELRRIAAICKREIDVIMHRMAIAEAIRVGGPFEDPTLSARDIKTLQKLIEYEALDIWSQKDFGKVNKGGLGTVGLRRFAEYREMTMASFIPVYLLLLIETAGNPVSIMEISLNCLEEHPLDKRLANLSWIKGRAANEQSMSFPVDGKYSAPNLVRLVRRMTESIRRMAAEPDKNLLFITRSGRLAKRISIQSAHNSLDRFRVTNELSYFTFSDIRRVVAGLHKDTYRNNSHVSELLQHRNSETVRHYLNRDLNSEKVYERINVFQGEIISRLSDRAEGSDYDTLFGMKCVDPKAGYIKGSKIGEPCMAYLSCATCKNAIVIFDDPDYVARIIKAKIFLEERERQSILNADETVRFSEAYLPVLNVIRNSIIPRIPKNIIAKASALLERTADLPLLY
ncbi:hypothetical protein F3G89_31195 [Pseudomonas aeruginosa]|uniref:hypothetical protein n=1 Tax=Pseudomonas aeruginosa TaxID=287 RepID=UPI000B1908E8|nr:hypothetical protein [Pseudomonas aeruginosa]KAA5622717.1 hypothetical protein F3G89_31195 [Pseudomonas aeruginosa]MBI7196581.1 hypothetical protein [Pseudomonas aeruginosa]MBX6272952.1 hypothetical protein [Pseudomonas aeruginosa]